MKTVSLAPVTQMIWQKYAVWSDIKKGSKIVLWCDGLKAKLIFLPDLMSLEEVLHQVKTVIKA